MVSSSGYNVKYSRIWFIAASVASAAVACWELRVLRVARSLLSTVRV